MYLRKFLKNEGQHSFKEYGEFHFWVTVYACALFTTEHKYPPGDRVLGEKRRSVKSIKILYESGMRWPVTYLAQCHDSQLVRVYEGKFELLHSLLQELFITEHTIKNTMGGALFHCLFSVFCAGERNRGQVSKLTLFVKNFLPGLSAQTCGGEKHVFLPSFDSSVS